MKIKDVVSLVARAEGKKSSVSVGNIREVLRCLRDLCRDDLESYSVVSNYIRYAKTDALQPKRRAKK